MNSETPSDLIYLADPPRIAWVREQGIEFSWARIDSRRNPLSGSCSNWSTGRGLNLLLASICKPSLILSLSDTSWFIAGTRSLIHC